MRCKIGYIKSFFVKPVKKLLLGILLIWQLPGLSEVTSIRIKDSFAPNSVGNLVLHRSKDNLVFLKDTLVANNNLFSWVNEDIKQPTYVLIEFSNRAIYTVYIFPGYDLLIERGKDGSIGFSGHGARTNKFLNDLSGALKPYHFSTGEQLPIDSLISKIDQFYDAKEALIQGSFFDAALPDESFFRYIELNGLKYARAGAILNLLNVKDAGLRKTKEVYDAYITVGLLNVTDPKLFISKDVRSFFVTYHEKYLDNRDNDRAPSQKVNTFEHKIYRAYKEYNEVVADFVIFKQAELSFYFADVLPGLGYFELLIDSAVNLFHDNAYAKTLINELENRKPGLERAANEFWKGKKAKEFEVIDSSNNVFNLASFSNKIIFIDVWASWCAPCIEKFPVIASLKDKYKADQDVVIIMISIDQDYQKWIRALRKYNPPGIQVLIKPGSFSSFKEDYGVQLLPQYLLIDKRGEIVFKGSDASLPDTAYAVIDRYKNK